MEKSTERKSKDAESADVPMLLQAFSRRTRQKRGSRSFTVFCRWGAAPAVLERSANKKTKIAEQRLRCNRLRADLLSMYRAAHRHELRRSRRFSRTLVTHPEQLCIRRRLRAFGPLGHQHAAAKILELRIACRSDAFRQHKGTPRLAGACVALSFVNYRALA